MNQDLHALVLASLLHDLAEFARRADEPDPWPVLQNNMPEGTTVANLVTASQSRGEIKDSSAKILNIAKILSVGATEEEKIHQIKGPWVMGKKRLLSVFEEIELQHHQFSAPGGWFYKLTPLEASDTIFPRNEIEDVQPDEYKKLYSEFLSALKTLDFGLPFHLYLSSLISLVEKYTWCIPASACQDLPDVSFFDYALTTAAIAQALYLYHAEKGTVPILNGADIEGCLFSGDLSGIQNFIFGISNSTGRGISKIFRARSFYLQALVKSVVLSIQERLGLLSVCKVMDAGGHFILLLPNLSDLDGQLHKLDDDLQTWFRHKFKGQLTLNLSWKTRMNHQDFAPKMFQAKLDQVNEGLEIAKLTKLRRTMVSSGPIVDVDYDEEEGKNCVICNVNRSDSASSKEYEKQYGVDNRLCKACYEQIDIIGTNLPKRAYHVYGKVGQVELFDNIFLTLTDDKPQDFKPVHLIETFRDGDGFSRSRIARYLPVLTDEELHDEKWFTALTEDNGFHDIKAGQIKTFNSIAQKSRKEQGGELLGRPLLAFMKGDVDYLGFIFGMGLGQRLTLARYAFLSRMMNLFFSDYMVKLVEREFPDIYVVFAGGDDLFVIGPWRQTLHFACRLRHDFSQFCGQNPDMTLSVGILMSRPRLPILRAAKWAEELLQLSKEYKTGNHVKDAVSLLNETITWGELKELLSLGDKFDKALEEKERTRFSSAFLHRLLEYHRMYKRFITPQGEIRAGLYLSHAHYDIGRNIMHEKADNKEELNMLLQLFAIGSPANSLLAKLNIPLFYAINLNRKEK